MSPSMKEGGKKNACGWKLLCSGPHSPHSQRVSASRLSFLRFGQACRNLPKARVSSDSFSPGRQSFMLEIVAWSEQSEWNTTGVESIRLAELRNVEC